MSLINPEHDNQKYKKPLKKAKIGFEIELHLIDEGGRIQNKAPDLINEVKKRDKDVLIVKECGKNMIEVCSYPDVATYNPALHLVDSLEKVYDVARGMGLYLYPFAVYPLEFKEELSSNSYRLQEKIFGKDKFKIATNCTGFHCHYTLPKSVFDFKIKNLRVLKGTKLGRSMIGSYNLGVAIDPALSLFAQSSPFYKGSHLAKDSRVVVYRGGAKLRYSGGLYSKKQQFGGLPPYKQTLTDLVDSQKRKWERWKRLVKKTNPRIDINKLYVSPLDVSWNAVKINKLGTLEHRGMDTNFLSILFAIATIYKFSLKKIQREFLEVLPTDFGITDSFKIENGVLFIPPHTHVRNKLQLWGAYNGYSKKEMYNYAKRFFNFARSVTPKKYSKLVNPLKEMIDKKESISDKILKYSKRKGYLVDNKISKSDGCELALYYAKKFHDDLEKTKEILTHIKSL